MAQVKIYKSGEVVRDTGLIQFYKILKEMDEPSKKIFPKLTKNYLELNIVNKESFIDSIFTYICKNILFKGFLWDLKAEKLSEDIYDDLQNKQTLGEVISFLNEKNIASSKIEKIQEKGEKIFFPYLRNSGKFGANSQNVANFHRNLRNLIEINIEMMLDTDETRNFYGYGNICSICQEYEASIYDITHKYDIKKIDDMPVKKRVYRKDSKNIYTLNGSETSTFNNYANSDANSSICFQCEFFNLMFLSYIKMNKPRYIISCSDLTHMDFMQTKINAKQNSYNKQAFYFHVAKLAQGNQVRLYQISIDANKGILLDFEKVIDYQELGKQIGMMELIDLFNMKQSTKEINSLKNRLKNFILNQNYAYIFQWMLSNIHADEAEQTGYNFYLLASFIEKENLGGKEMRKKNLSITGTHYYNYGKSLSSLPSKDRIAFQLTQLLQSSNQIDILSLLQRFLYTYKDVEKKVSQKIIESMPDDIVLSSKKECSYYVGKFISGLYSKENNNMDENKSVKGEEN